MFSGLCRKFSQRNLKVLGQSQNCFDIYLQVNELNWTESSVLIFHMLKRNLHHMSCAVNCLYSDNHTSHVKILYVFCVADFIILFLLFPSNGLYTVQFNKQRKTFLTR